MKKSMLRYSVMAAGMALLVGCGGGDKKEVVHDCVYPSMPDRPAPGWICDQPVDGVEVSAVGSAQKSAAGPAFMKQMAATRARVELAQRMKVHVANMVKQYAETTGAGTTETVDMVNTSVTKQITKETLTGTKIWRTHTAPDGTLYVLIGLDDKAVQQSAEKALKTSMKNEQALWQQFKAQKAQDELAAEISKVDPQ